MGPHPIKNFHLIKSFIDAFLDKRTIPYKNLKAAVRFSREVIEKRLSQSSEINNLILQDKERSVWLRELIINYTLLKIHHHIILWGIDDHKPQLEEIDPDLRMLF